MRKGIRLLAFAMVFVMCMATPVCAYSGVVNPYNRQIAAGVDVQADYIKRISEIKSTRLWNEAIVTAGLPEAKGFANEVLERSFNLKVQEAYNSLLAKAGEKAHAITIDYSVVWGSNYVSVLIRSISSAAFTQERYACIVFSVRTEKLLNINDVLGANGVRLANRVLAEQVKAAPGRFNPTVAEISVDHDFYMEDNRLVLVFDQFAIAPGSEGVLRVPIALDGVTNFIVDKSDYYVSPVSQFNVKMIPIRPVSEAFGYDVVWNSGTTSVDLRQGGTLVTAIQVNENSYFRGRSPKRRLEAAPEVYLGRTHVPISFFEEILDLLYHVDSHGNIILTNYTESAGMQ